MSTFTITFGDQCENHVGVSGIQTIELNGGDIYIMSSKAVGCDWKSSSTVTLRHAAGPLSNVVKVSKS